MIEELNSKSEDTILFQSWAPMSRLDYNYTKTKFVVVEIRSVKHPKLLLGDPKNYSCECYKHLGMHFDRKLIIVEYISHVTAKLAQHSGIVYKLRATLNEKQLIQYIR